MPAHASSALFEQLALPLLPSLYSHAYWLSRNHAEAEDIVQETLTKALRAFSSFEVGTNFKAWVFRILRNTFLTSRTAIAASRTVFLEDQTDLLDFTDAGPSPEDHLLRLNNHAALTEALERLDLDFVKFCCFAKSRILSTRKSRWFSMFRSAPSCRASLAHAERSTTICDSNSGDRYDSRPQTPESR